MPEITAKRLRELAMCAPHLYELEWATSGLPTIEEYAALIAAYRERGRLSGVLARIAEYDFQGNPINDAAVALEPKS